MTHIMQKPVVQSETVGAGFDGDCYHFKKAVRTLRKRGENIKKSKTTGMYYRFKQEKVA